MYLLAHLRAVLLRSLQVTLRARRLLALEVGAAYDPPTTISTQKEKEEEGGEGTHSWNC